MSLQLDDYTIIYIPVRLDDDLSYISVTLVHWSDIGHVRSISLVNVKDTHFCALQLPSV